MNHNRNPLRFSGLLEHACGINIIISYHLFMLLLKDYRDAHPEVTVLDPPDAIQQVHNRQSMLQDVADLNLSDPYGNILIHAL